MQVKPEHLGRLRDALSWRTLAIALLLMISAAYSACSSDAFHEDAYAGQTEQAYRLIGDEKYDEAIAVLDDVLKESSRNNSANHYMAWAYYYKGEYVKAQDYAQIALDIQPNAEDEYVVWGDILLETSEDRNEALEAYNQALAINPQNTRALYGKAMASYYLGDFEGARKLLYTYTHQIPDDPDGHEQLVYTLIDQKNYQDALIEAQWFIDHKEYRRKGYVLKASCAYFMGDINESDRNAGLFIAENKESLHDLSVWHILRSYVTSNGDYAYAIALDKFYSAAYPDAYECYLDMADASMWLNRYEEAKTALQKAISISPDAPEPYNMLGDVCANQTEYNQAIDLYAKACSLDAAYDLARSNRIWALYQAGRYEELIALCTAQEEALADHDTYYYMAMAYEGLYDYDKAILYFSKALEAEGGMRSDTCYQLALAYLQKRDLLQAEKFNQKALSLDNRNQDALWLSEELLLLTTPLGNQLADFIEENYLYKEFTEDLDVKLNALKQCKTLSEAESLLENILLKDDYFSFLVTGQDYQDYLKSQEKPTVSHEVKISRSGMTYHNLKIDAFELKTALEFKKAVEAIPDKENQTLVIDLRGNTGGDMKACSDILDYLLGQCVTVSIIDRDGNASNYTSSADKTEFKKIIILQDDMTASASELLILGILQYSDATLIGEKTYGKGVAQIVFDSPENGFALLLVNAYWNVRQANIYYYGITPDVETKTALEFEKAIDEALQGKP